MLCGLKTTTNTEGRKYIYKWCMQTKVGNVMLNKRSGLTFEVLKCCIWYNVAFFQLFLCVSVTVYFSAVKCLTQFISWSQFFKKI